MILSFIKGSFIINPLPVKEKAPAETFKGVDNSPAAAVSPQNDPPKQKLTLEETFESIYNKRKEQLVSQRFERELIAGSKKSYG